MKSVHDFAKMKNQNEPITMVTCYDHTTAKWLNESTVDALLIGDSLMMTIYGHENTLQATPEILAQHISAVVKGAPSKFIVGDMPFLAHRGSMDRTLEAVRVLMQAGAQAIKIEGIDGSEKTIAHIVESGVPVMGHLGLTPQSVHGLGGFKVQGTSDSAADGLLRQALAAQECGVFALVLECVPVEVGRRITQKLNIPTIGIGAGPWTTGQILVIQDLLGMDAEFKPRFVRHYLSGAQVLKEAVNHFVQDVKQQKFPLAQESFGWN